MILLENFFSPYPNVNSIYHTKAKKKILIKQRPTRQKHEACQKNLTFRNYHIAYHYPYAYERISNAMLTFWRNF